MSVAVQAGVRVRQLKVMSSEGVGLCEMQNGAAGVVFLGQDLIGKDEISTETAVRP